MRLRLGAVGTAAVFGAVGCGGGDDPDRPPTHPVTGVVTYKDAPVPDATVTFAPQDPAAGRAAFGRTGPDGRYSLTTFEPDDGAVAGTFLVTVTKFEQAAVTDAAPTESAEYVPPPDNAKPAPPPKSLIPAKYGQPGSSGLRADVKEGGITFDITLTD